jgi:predicted transposase YbfD/YdcC
MPAPVSLQIKRAAGKPVGQVLDQVVLCLLTVLREQVTDPRARRGRRYELAAVLALAVVAVTCDCGSFVAIHQFGCNLSDRQRSRLGLPYCRFTRRVKVPSEKRIRQLLGITSPGELVAAVGRFTAHRLESAGMGKVPVHVAVEREQRRREKRQAQRTQARPAGRRALAADGKTLRGSGTDRHARVHLVAIVEHENLHVLERIAVDGKTTEVPELRAHLQNLDLSGSVLTLDALHTCAETASTILQAGGHYLLTVKANTPSLRGALIAKLATGNEASWAGHSHTWTERGHGRIDRRTIRVAPVERGDGIEFPGAAQIAMTIRRTTPTNKDRKGSKEIAFTITSLPAHETTPAQLGAYQQGHWGSESRHWILDVVFGEDANQTSTPRAVQNLSTLRHTAYETIKAAGHANTAYARRDLRDRKDDALAMYGL